ncbi:hypothetical protein DKG77_01950 [Flagellimonas aquimarina]|jgi:hypothetical protein|uniref:Lipoprotein n=1 Tax=Flagellimonas aquimarina TaxID=2201895 RepID=A0A316L3X4_9FLAO|nr:hypothetical protein [Allomuricauda koreensis]PWL39619.1 hypothetical protein DKG77_01950 [Allomuricauda koreensis]
MNRTLTIIIAVAAVALLIQSCLPSGKPSRPNQNLLPVVEVFNDKLISVRSVKKRDLEKAIEQFCNMYNQESFRALPRLFAFGEEEFVITFPYDIDFATFCVFVNYLHYPNDIGYDPAIRGWTTAKEKDEWVQRPIDNKKVMLFIPKSDDEYDNVYLTSEENFSVKIGFAIGHHFKPFSHPVEYYEEPIYSFGELVGKEFIDFR